MPAACGRMLTQPLVCPQQGAQGDCSLVLRPQCFSANAVAVESMPCSCQSGERPHKGPAAALPVLCPRASASTAISSPTSPCSIPGYVSAPSMHGLPFRPSIARLCCPPAAPSALQEQLRSLTMLVPLGAGLHAQAAVPDASRIYLHVGLGFHPGKSTRGVASVPTWPRSLGDCVGLAAERGWLWARTEARRERPPMPVWVDPFRLAALGSWLRSNGMRAWCLPQANLCQSRHARFLLLQS